MELLNTVAKKVDWFKAKVSGYQKALTRYAGSIVKNWETAKEVVQEVFLRLWRQPEIENELALKVWLFKTCRNHCIDLLRREGRMSQLLDSDEASLPCPNELPSEVIEKQQLQSCILEKMKTLPEKHQEVLRLKFQEDLTYQEISEVTGHTVNHVGVILHQALVNLRFSFSQSGGSHES